MASLNLKRNSQQKALISLVPMVDVMLILLVFFMVTSTYLDLDMVPAIEGRNNQAGTSTSTDNLSPPLMIRIDGNGQPALRGKDLTHAELGDLVQAILSEKPLTSILVLPSASANMQALISVMESVTNAGATRLRVIRLDAL